MVTQKIKHSSRWGAALVGALLLAAGTAVPVSAQNKAQAKAPALKTTEFPDGTGTVGLPAGWRIDGAYRGSVGCKGPNGASVLMGFPWTVLRPDSTAVTMPGALEAMGPVAVAPVGDLSAALREVMEKNGSRLTSLRSKPAPSGLPGVPAKFFLYEFEKNGKAFVGMGYFSSVGDGSETIGAWQLYSSVMIAPKERFMKELPTLLAIYNTWRPNGQKPKEGSHSALIDAMNDANRKRAADTLKSQQEAFERMNAKFLNEVIRQ